MINIDILSTWKDDALVFRGALRINQCMILLLNSNAMILDL